MQTNSNTVVLHLFDTHHSFSVRERISRRTEHHNFVNGFVRVQEVVSDEFEMAEKGANSSVSDSSDVVAARLFLGELVKVQGRDIETMGRNRYADMRICIYVYCFRDYYHPTLH